MAALIEFLHELFVTLFALDPKELEKRRKLRSIYNKIKTMNPPYYRRSTAMILPGLASILLELFRLLEPIRTLLEKTILNEDSRLAELYRDYLIKVRLPEEHQTAARSFTYEPMKVRVAASSNPQSELLSIQRDFQAFLDLFNTEAFESFNLEYTELERLSSLCRYDFREILLLFDPSFNPGHKERPFEFDSIPAEKVIQGLLDLYFILAGIDLSRGVGKNLGYLIERLERERAEEGKQKASRMLVRIDKLLKQSLSPDLIIGLIRLIKKDPDLSPRTMHEPVQHLDSFKARITVAYLRDRERIEREISEQAVSQELKTLFQDAELLEIRGYNEKTSDLLQSKGFAGFTKIKPLRIIKSYILAIFEKKLRDSLKKLVVEGYFENKIFQNAFSSTFYGCEGIIEMIRRLEEGLSDSGQVTLATIHKYLDKHEEGKEVRAVLNKLVDTIDWQAGKVLEDGTNLFYNLSTQLAEVLDDARQKNPVHITNIKVIGGKNNREFLSDLARGYNDLIKFIRIMRNFTVVHQKSVPES